MKGQPELDKINRGEIVRFLRSRLNVYEMERISGGYPEGRPDGLAARIEELKELIQETETWGVK